MKEELLKYFDKIDLLLKQGDYILFELAFVLYERCDYRPALEKLSENEIKELRKHIAKYSVIDEYLQDKIDNLVGDVI